MKSAMIGVTVYIFFQSFGFNGYAQAYSRGEQSMIQPLQVLIENYTMISLRKEMEKNSNSNLFDKSNPYSYLQIIYDEAEKPYQILIQVNFSGKILFLAYSNNLTGIFNKADKPFNVFFNCLKEVNSHISPVQNTETAINCIIERLNYCSSL